MKGFKLVLWISLIGILLLSACQPTPSDDQIQSAASTMLAQTQAANGAQQLPSSTPAPLPTNTAQPLPTQTSAPTASPLPTQTNTVAPTTTPTAINTSTPTSASVLTISKFADVATFEIDGAPDRVDKDSVLRATGADAYGNTFTNTTGLGSEMMLAEPGSILYGPDEPASVVNANPHGEYISPINQQMLGTETFATNTAEGAFTWATGAKMTIAVGDFTIRVESTSKSCSNNWFVMIRGLFPDGKQDSDRNSTTRFSDYVAGHTQVMWYPAGAYISEENFLQVSDLSHTGGRNCGAEGTSGLSVLMLDLNTGAWAVFYQSNLNQPWQLIESNWQ